MKTELFLAWKFLKPRRSAVSLITITSILGVTLGVAVLMIVLAVMTGFTDLMKIKLVETQSHFQIRSLFGSIRDTGTLTRILDHHQIKSAPVIQAPVLIQYGRTRLDTQVVMFGADPEDLRTQLDLENKLVSGKAELDDRKVIISRNMAQRWNLRPGDRILLHSPQKLTSLVQISPSGGVSINPQAEIYLPEEFTVSGIYELGKYDFDRMVLFTGLDDAADILDLPWGSATAILCWGPDPFDQQHLVKSLRRELPQNYHLSTWEETNSQMLAVLDMEKRMMFFLLIFIVLVAAFSITNTLITSAYQKTREIGLVKAIGGSDGFVLKVFVLQGFWIGLLGSISGTVLGYLVIRFRNEILNFASWCSGRDLFPKEFYYFDSLPAHIVISDVAVIVISSICLCTLGALLPAWRAARLDPAAALRYE